MGKKEDPGSVGNTMKLQERVTQILPKSLQAGVELMLGYLV